MCANTYDLRVADETTWVCLVFGWDAVTSASDFEIESSWMVGSLSSDDKLAMFDGGGRDIFRFSTTLW